MSSQPLLLSPVPAKGEGGKDAEAKKEVVDSKTSEQETPSPRIVSTTNGCEEEDYKIDLAWFS